MTSATANLPLRLGQLLSVQAGRVQSLGVPGASDPLQRPWRSAFFKKTLSGRVQVATLGVEGDEQADRKHHGGPDQAILMYSADHFEGWRRDFGLAGLSGGGFGENLTVSGFAEPDVCIGDRLRVGGVLFEVSQQRNPCSNINRRWARPGITEAVAATGRAGWYLRVVETGLLEAGDEVHLVARPNPGASVALLLDAYYGRVRRPEAFDRLIACSQLSPGIRAGLEKRRLALSPV